MVTPVGARASILHDELSIATNRESYWNSTRDLRSGHIQRPDHQDQRCNICVLIDMAVYKSDHVAAIFFDICAGI